MRFDHPLNRLCLALMFCLQIVPAQAISSVVDLRISGLADVVGDLYVFVYNSEKDWLGGDALLMRKVDIASARERGIVSVQFELSPGEYAMSIKQFSL